MYEEKPFLTCNHNNLHWADVPVIWFIPPQVGNAVHTPCEVEDPNISQDTTDEERNNSILPPVVPGDHSWECETADDQRWNVHSEIMVVH